MYIQRKFILALFFIREVNFSIKDIIGLDNSAPPLDFTIYWDNSRLTLRILDKGEIDLIGTPHCGEKKSG